MQLPNLCAAIAQAHAEECVAHLVGQSGSTRCHVVPEICSQETGDFRSSWSIRKSKQVLCRSVRLSHPSQTALCCSQAEFGGVRHEARAWLSTWHAKAAKNQTALT